MFYLLAFGEIENVSETTEPFYTVIGAVSNEWSCTIPYQPKVSSLAVPEKTNVFMCVNAAQHLILLPLELAASRVGAKFSLLIKVTSLGHRLLLPVQQPICHFERLHKPNMLLPPSFLHL